MTRYDFNLRSTEADQMAPLFSRWTEVPDV